MTSADARAEDARELIVLCDADDRIRFVSLSFTQLFGSEPGLWAGKRFSPVAEHPAPDSRPLKFRTSAAGPGGYCIIDWRLTTFGSGERLYAGRVSRERRRIETEIAAPAGAPKSGDAENAGAAHFIATMSHEMRTPLNGVIGMTELLLDTDLSLNQRSYVEAIKESGSSLLSLINDLLDFSKLRAGKLDLEPGPFDPDRLVQGVVEMLAPRAAEKGIEIAGFVAPGTPARIIGDENRIRQILVNLANNAVKFTDSGGVLIEAEATPRTDGRHFFRFTVHDTGVGVSPEMQARIFDEFEQAGEGEARAEGAGLGLAICRRLADAMGGGVSLVSEKGAGSAFTFALVVAAVSSETTCMPAELPERNVIVATRSKIIANYFHRLFASLGAEAPEIVADGEALARAIARTPDAFIVCDQSLVDEAPRDVLQAAARSLALIPATGRARIPELKARGFDAYLVKPIRQATLMREFFAPAADAGGAANLAEAPAPPLPRTRPEPAPAAAPAAGLNILLAEDNRINAVLATTLIRRAGHAVEVAENGAEAVAAAADRAFDIVFMDMHMPQMDGLAATHAIRSGGGPNATSPIIALTANAMANDRRKCLAAGMDDFLSKPFDPGDLDAMVTKWAAGRASARQAS